ncbi:MAG: phosphotransferase [archaeon]|nr:phosphotransferase [archaeon]MCP8319811.1 phosphotransferase [archaeon]
MKTIIHNLKPFLRDFLEGIGAEDFVLISTNYPHTGMTKLLLFQDKKPKLLIKLCTIREFATVLKKEYDALVSIHWKMKSTVPCPIGFYDFCDFSALVETALTGVQLETLLKKANYEEYLRLFVNWLINFHYLTHQGELPLSQYPWRPEFQNVLCKFKEEMQECWSIKIPYSSLHGDLTPQNILVNNSGFTVIDWEKFMESGPSLIDLYSFITYSAIFIFGDIDLLLRDTWFSRITKRHLDKYYRCFSIKRDLTELMLPLTILHTMESQLAPHLAAGNRPDMWMAALQQCLK